MCLLVILTGQSSALFWRPALPTYPTDPNDPYYQAFETVPPPSVTANKLMTNFLGYGQSAVITKRSSIIEDIVIVLDGSGSVGSCEFKKGKEALKHMMTTLHKPGYDSKYAAVTFASSATVSFKFLPYTSAANEITKISYPSGSTNTQAGLAEAKKLFDDPSSGLSPFPTRRMVFLVTDGQSNVDDHLTIPNADKLKNSGVDIYVVAVGTYINGIDEIVKVASYPPDQFLFRVKDLAGFWDIIKLIVKQVSPGKYSIVNYDPPC
ncbi:complement factor B-like [Oculina patagonica]